MWKQAEADVDEPRVALSAQVMQFSNVILYERLHQRISSMLVASSYRDRRAWAKPFPSPQTYRPQFVKTSTSKCFLVHYRSGGGTFPRSIRIPISAGTVHNRLQTTAEKVAESSQSQDLSDIEVGLHDEIYQSNRPVLVSVDAASTYCYLLKGVEHQDEDTWGWHLLNVMEQDFALTVLLTGELF